MKFQIIAAASLLLAGSAVCAQDREEREQGQAEATATGTAQSRDDEQLEEEDPGEEVICRTERVTGSLTRRRRTCMTENEWAALEARTRDDLIRSGRMASGGVECRQDQFGGC